MAGEGIDTRIRPDAEGFRKQWVYVNAAQYSPLLQVPSVPAEPSSRWEHERLTDPRLTPVITRIADLRAADVTMMMVVVEFTWRRIAPLQCPSRPMWAFTGREDAMRLQVASLPPSVLGGILCLLTGGEAHALPPEGLPLYSRPNRGSFFQRMSRFDEWGLLPEGHTGPRDNPFLATPGAGGSLSETPLAVMEGRISAPAVSRLTPTPPRDGGAGL